MTTGYPHQHLVRQRMRPEQRRHLLRRGRAVRPVLGVWALALVVAFWWSRGAVDASAKLVSFAVVAVLLTVVAGLVVHYLFAVRRDLEAGTLTYHTGPMIWDQQGVALDFSPTLRIILPGGPRLRRGGARFTKAVRRHGARPSWGTVAFGEYSRRVLLVLDRDGDVVYDAGRL